MIGIVIVSHSATLAAGVREIVAQMVRNKVPLAVAGGMDDAEDIIGTDPLRVLRAIEAVYSEDGVVVLMDLGSAILSAEAALDFLSPEQRQQVHLCEAPLVEGALAAAVRAMAGGSIAQVLAEARGALNAKRKQLGAFAPGNDENAAGEVRSKEQEAGGKEQEADDPSQTLSIIVPNQLGLHIRPAAKLVELASQFPVEITITKDDQTVSANSINQIAMLSARQGDTLVFRAVGGEAAAALNAIEALVLANFGDTSGIGNAENGVQRTLQSIEGTRIPSAVRHPPPLPDVADHVLGGIPASSGVAFGPAQHYQAQAAAVHEYEVSDVQAEWLRLNQAIIAALDELNQLLRLTKQLGDAEAAIFAAHRLILSDAELQAAAQTQIMTQRLNAEAAWQRAVEALAERYRMAPHFDLRQRAIDVMEVGQRVVRQLTGHQPPTLVFNQPSILVATRLAPSDTATLDASFVLGIITEEGGAMDHSSILARALGIPAVVGVTDALKRVTSGQLIALDGDSGKVWLALGEYELAALQQQRSQQIAQRAMTSQQGRRLAAQRESKLVEVAANIGDPREAALALAFGADGVGLFRTEFLFMGRATPPTEEEQFVAYSTAAQTLGNRSLMIRTLDAGGDKPLLYFPAGLEPNPYLGLRGIRYWLAYAELARTQVRALLRTHARHPIKLMLPMVSTLDELQHARTLIDAGWAELQTEGVTFDNPLAIGIMVETPGAVMLAHQLARHVDFFSIGTNDLAQYMLVADRGNPRVAALVNPLQPAVILAIQQVVQAAHAAGIGVSVCGELAGDPLATPLLVGLGVHQLSMNLPAIPQVRDRLLHLDMRQAEELARQALEMNSVAEVVCLLQDSLEIISSPQSPVRSPESSQITLRSTDY